MDIFEVRGSLGNRQIVDEEMWYRPESIQLIPNHIRTLGNECPDPRAISEVEISNLVGGNSYLKEDEKIILIDLLRKYAPFLTSRPGRCKVSEYGFQLVDDKPFVGQVRPIPFKLRPVVREHLNQLSDDIIEVSDSPFLNPLTVVPREGKAPRICVDAGGLMKYSVWI